MPIDAKPDRDGAIVVTAAPGCGAAALARLISSLGAPARVAHVDEALAAPGRVVLGYRRPGTAVRVLHRAAAGRPALGLRDALAAWTETCGRFVAHAESRDDVVLVDTDAARWLPAELRERLASRWPGAIGADPTRLTPTPRVPARHELMDGTPAAAWLHARLEARSLLPGRILAAPATAQGVADADLETATRAALLAWGHGLDVERRRLEAVAREHERQLEGLRHQVALLGGEVLHLERELARAASDPPAAPGDEGTRVATDARALAKRVLPPPLVGLLRRLRNPPPRVSTAPAWTWQGAFDHAPALARGGVVVHGWVVRSHGRVSSVEVRCGGRSLAARTGLPRPDLHAALGLPEAHLCGFQAELDLSTLPPEQTDLELRATARGLDGEEFELPARRLRVRAASRVGALPRAVQPARTAGNRILAFTHSLAPGGAQRVLSDLLLDLRRVGHEIDLLSPADGPLGHELEAAGIGVRVVGPHPVHSGADYWNAVQSLAAWARERRVGLVIANTLGAFHAVDVAAAAGVPVHWLVHESFPPAIFWRVGYAAEIDPVVSAFGQRALGTATSVVFVAEATRRLFAAAVPAERSRVIAYGLDLEAVDRFRAASPRDAARRALGVDADAFVLLCAATIEPRKGQTRLLQAFAEVAPRHPRARLVLVGDQPGPYSEGLHRYLRDAGLADRVRVEPVTAAPWAWFAAADALVLASDVESLPRCLMEAMAFGLCIAAARVFGVGDMVEDGVSGLLFEANDLGALTAALDRLLALSPAERAAFAARGRDRVERRYSGPGWLAAHRGVISGLMAPARATPPRVPARASDRLAFVHVPKCAGSFVESYLANHVLGPLGYAIHNSWACGLGRDWSPQELEWLRGRDHGLAYVHNHVVNWPRDVARRYAAAGWLTFAFFRHPGDQLASFYHWARKRGASAGEHEGALRLDLDAFMAEVLQGRSFPRLLASLGPPAWWPELGECLEFGQDSFAGFLARHFGHEYGPQPAVNRSSNPGYAALRESGAISERTHLLLEASSALARYRAAVAARPVAP